MTSVPISGWIANLSSLAWIGIATSILIGFLLIKCNVFNWPWKIITTWFIIGCLGVFVIDQLILSPLFFYYIKRRGL